MWSWSWQARAKHRLYTWQLMTQELTACHCLHGWSSQQKGSWRGFWTSWLPQNLTVLSFLSRVKLLLSMCMFVCSGRTQHLWILFFPMTTPPPFALG
jgi:hypothetical protein